MNIKNLFKKRTSKIEELSEKIENLENRIFQKDKPDTFFSFSIFPFSRDYSLEEKMDDKCERLEKDIREVENKIEAVKKYLDIKTITTKSEVVAIKKVKKIKK